MEHLCERKEGEPRERKGGREGGREGGRGEKRRGEERRGRPREGGSHLVGRSGHWKQGTF